MKGNKIFLKKKKEKKRLNIIANTMKIFLKIKNKGQQKIEETIL